MYFATNSYKHQPEEGNIFSNEVDRNSDINP